MPNKEIPITDAIALSVHRATGKSNNSDLKTKLSLLELIINALLLLIFI